MEIKCKNCKRLSKCSNFDGKYWCSWYGIFRKPTNDVCLNGFKCRKKKV